MARSARQGTSIGCMGVSQGVKTKALLLWKDQQRQQLPNPEPGFPLDSCETLADRYECITDAIKPKRHAIQNVYFKLLSDGDDDEVAMGDTGPCPSPARKAILWMERRPKHAKNWIDPLIPSIHRRGGQASRSRRPSAHTILAAPWWLGTWWLAGPEDLDRDVGTSGS
jgi:hypothetical protein